MKKREGGILAWAAAVFLLVGMAAGCSRSEEARYQLNPKQPVMITVWNYYNGQTKQAFDNLVSRFNETVGMEMGIIVELWRCKPAGGGGLQFSQRKAGS